MTEIWVHGNTFMPRLYGPEHLGLVGGVSGTEFWGMREHYGVRFAMRDERVNSFHTTIPVTGASDLVEVRIEVGFRSIPIAADLYEPSLERMAISDGRKFLVSTASPTISMLPSLGSVLDDAVPGRQVSVGNIQQQVTRGICVSLEFSTVGPHYVGPGEVWFYSAGALFA
jgi:hypothetical protein